MTYRFNSKKSLASTTWDDFIQPPAPKLREPENQKAIEVIHFKVTDESVDITFYLEGILNEQFKSIDRDTLYEWAVSSKDIQVVYELPYYDPESDEEYIRIYPATSEQGTAEQINANRFQQWLNELTDEGVERILKHWCENRIS